MGGSSSKTIQSSAAYVSSVMMNSAVTSNTNCSAASSIVQNQTVTIDNTEQQKTVQLCLTLANGNAAVNKTCKDFIQAANVSDITQGASIVLTTDCTVDTKMLAQMQQDVSNAIMNKITSSTDDIGEFLKSVAIAAGGKSNDTTSMTSTVSNMVSSTMTLSATQNMITTLSQQQNQQLNLKSFTGTMKGLNQMLQVQAISTLVASNSATNAAVQKATNSTTNDVTSSSNLTNVFDGLWKTLQTGLGVMGAWIYAVYAVVALIILCSCFMCLGSMMGGKGGGGGNAAPGSAVNRYIPSPDQAASLVKLLRV